MFDLQSKYALNFRVGAFFILIITLLSVSLIAIKDNTGFLVPKYSIKINFYNVKGLQKGTVVKLAGVAVGYVQDIAFSKKIDDYQITVTVKINKNVQERIRTDSVAYLESSSVISDKYIEISLGSIESPRVLENGVIFGKQ